MTHFEQGMLFSSSVGNNQFHSDITAQVQRYACTSMALKSDGKIEVFNERMEQIKEEPVAVFSSRLSLLALNIIIRVFPVALVVLLAYLATLMIEKSIPRTDPTILFLRYWPYILLLCLLLAAIWTLWFHIVKIYAYKDKMVLCKRGKRWMIEYSTIISFTCDRSVMVIIPMPTQKDIIATGAGRTNKVWSCSCISKQDFLQLHHICNTGRPEGHEIPLKRSVVFHA